MFGGQVLNFRDKIIRFMYGRYGKDELEVFLTVVFYIVFVLGLFIRSYIMPIIMAVLLSVIIFRSFSRNIERRRDENNVYLKIRNPIKNFFVLRRNIIRDRKTHIYKKCPHCRAVLRLPRAEKGTHRVKCPKCSQFFEIKIKR